MLCGCEDLVDRPGAVAQGQYIDSAPTEVVEVEMCRPRRRRCNESQTIAATEHVFTNGQMDSTEHDVRLDLTQLSGYGCKFSVRDGTHFEPGRETLQSIRRIVGCIDDGDDFSGHGLRFAIHLAYSRSSTSSMLTERTAGINNPRLTRPLNEPCRRVAARVR